MECYGLVRSYFHRVILFSFPQMGPAIGVFNTGYMMENIKPWLRIGEMSGEYSLLCGPNCQSKVNDLIELIGVRPVGGFGFFMPQLLGQDTVVLYT